MNPTLITSAPAVRLQRRATVAHFVTPNQDNAKLLEDNYIGRMNSWRRWPTARYRNDEQALWLSTGINVPTQFHNTIYRYRFSAGDLYPQIERALAQVKFPQAPLYWLVADADNPATVGAYLEEYGAQSLGVVWGMVAHLDPRLAKPAPVSGLRIRRVSTIDQVKSFVDTVIAEDGASPLARQQWINFEIGLGLDATLPWQRYLAYWQGEVVASAAVFYGATAAGLYHVTTAPQARGKGIGSAITRFALQQALLRNYRQSVLIATPMSIDIYRRLGFRHCTSIHAYFFSRKHQDAIDPVQ